MYSELVSSVKAQLTKRLLHLGVTTQQLLTVYINLVKVHLDCLPSPFRVFNGLTQQAFLVLDPRGSILEAVAEPVQKVSRPSGPTGVALSHALLQYLCSRSDTVKCIVASLVNDEEGEVRWK